MTFNNITKSYAKLLGGKPTDFFGKVVWPHIPSCEIDDIQYRLNVLLETRSPVAGKNHIYVPTLYGNKKILIQAHVFPLLDKFGEIVSTRSYINII